METMSENLKTSLHNALQAAAAHPQEPTILLALADCYLQIALTSKAANQKQKWLENFEHLENAIEPLYESKCLGNKETGRLLELSAIIQSHHEARFDLPRILVTARRLASLAAAFCKEKSGDLTWQLYCARVHYRLCLVEIYSGHLDLAAERLRVASAAVSGVTHSLNKSDAKLLENIQAATTALTLPRIVFWPAMVSGPLSFRVHRWLFR